MIPSALFGDGCQYLFSPAEGPILLSNVFATRIDCKLAFLLSGMNTWSVTIQISPLPVVLVGTDVSSEKKASISLSAAASDSCACDNALVAKSCASFPRAIGLTSSVEYQPDLSLTSDGAVGA